MAINKNTLAGIKEDVLGAGLHFLSGAGSDLKLMIQQAVKNVVGDAYVSKKEYDALVRRVAALEGKKPSKTVVKAPASKAKTTAKPGRK